MCVISRRKGEIEIDAVMSGDSITIESIMIYFITICTIYIL